MLVRLTSKWRWRAASILVVLYALCVAAPTAALALSDKSVPVHCLTDDHHMIGTDNVHNDGSSHQHSSTGDDDHGQPGKCCGLYGLSAIVPDIDFIVGQRPPVSHLASLIANNLSGRGSDRIDRPPRSLLSL
jgi:hypothetical protein